MKTEGYYLLQSIHQITNIMFTCSKKICNNKLLFRETLRTQSD